MCSNYSLSTTSCILCLCVCACVCVHVHACSASGTVVVVVSLMHLFPQKQQMKKKGIYWVFVVFVLSWVPIRTEYYLSTLSQKPQRTIRGTQFNYRRDSQSILKQYILTPNKNIKQFWHLAIHQEQSLFGNRHRDIRLPKLKFILSWHDIYLSSFLI